MSVQDSRTVRILGYAVNAALRGALGVAAWRVVTRPSGQAPSGDKGLRPRLAAVAAATLMVPVVHAVRHRSAKYPVWVDNLYLSLFVVDAGGNALRLFSRRPLFDILPHFHGPGATTVVVGHVFDCSARRAFLIGQALHVLLEVQEHLSDHLFGLDNVKGHADTARDMVAGLAGGALYAAAWHAADHS